MGKYMFFGKDMSGWRLVSTRTGRHGVVLFYFERNTSWNNWVTIYVAPNGEVW